MKTADINTNLIDSYFTLLKSLSPDNKLELIAKLSKSMKTTKKAKDISWKSLFGALELDQSADDFVEDLKKDRKFNLTNTTYGTDQSAHQLQRKC